MWWTSVVNFFVFPIRKLPILVLDPVELDGNGKSDHQQLKQEDGWGTAAFPFLSPQQGSNYSSDSVSQECIRGVSWCHDDLMVASAGSWFVLCRFSLFCPGEMFSNKTHLPQGDIIFIGRYFEVMAHKPRIQAAARLPGGQVLLKRLPLTSSRVHANQNAASVTLQLCPAGHLRVQRRFCHPSGEY